MTHLSQTYRESDRGFRHYEAISTSYGHEVRVYESSAAATPHLWLSITQTEETARAAYTNIAPESATAHLTLDQARAIRDALDDAINGHYQVR